MIKTTKISKVHGGTFTRNAVNGNFVAVSTEKTTSRASEQSKIAIANASRDHREALERLKDR